MSLSDLRTFLLADAGISALVGTRIYPSKLPQNAVMPAIVYLTISGEDLYAQDGPSDLEGPRIQIDAWGDDYGQADEVYNAIRDRLSGYRGPAGNVEIQGAFLVGKRDFYEDATDQHRRSSDYMIWFS